MEPVPFCGLYDHQGQPDSLVSCQWGAWPGSNEPAPQFAVASVQTLQLTHVSMDFQDYQPLFGIQTKTLRLDNINRGDNSRFPFRDFVRNVAKSMVENLVITYVSLGRIDRADFEEFSSLQSLNIQNSNLETIHPDSFQHFAAKGPDTTVFESLVIALDRELVSFPWESLRSFTDSLELLSLGGEVLSKITYQGSAKAMQFKVLESVFLTNSCYRTIPQNVPDTFTYDQKPSPTALYFTYNGNQCREPHLLEPLVKWVKAQSTSGKF